MLEMAEKGCEECYKPFSGEVFSGRGEGAFYVSIYAKSFRRVIGYTPYPGTLNIRLKSREDVEIFNECISMIPKKIVEPPKVEGARLARVIVFPILVNGYPAWGVRPEITVYKNDVVEVVADKFLREMLGLKDGDTVYISLVWRGGEE